VGLRILRADFLCVAASVSDKISRPQKSFSNPSGTIRNASQQANRDILRRHRLDGEAIIETILR
jgi:hypothetical protein